MMNFLPLPDGGYLLTGDGRTKSEIAKFSQWDADRYDAYGAKLEAIARIKDNLSTPGDSSVNWALLLTLPARKNGDYGMWWNGVGVLRFRRC